MTVRELIVVLQAMPQDAVVIYDLFSDVDEMREDEVKLIRAEDKKIVKRNGKYESYRSQWVEAGANVEFVTVVNFPGN